MPIDITSELVSGLVGSGMGYAIQVGVDRARRSRASKQFREVWHFLTERTAIVVPLVSTSPVPGSAGMGDLLGMSLLIRQAEAHFGGDSKIEILRVSNSSNSSLIDFDGHLVVIGGGEHNPLFRKLIAELKVPLHFFDTEMEGFKEIRNETRSVIYAPEHESDESVRVDTGLAVRALRSQSPKRWVVLAAGSYTYGSEAAMMYLTSNETLHELSKYLDRNVEVVVQAKVRDHSVSDVKRISSLIVW